MIERSIHPNTRVILEAWQRMTANPTGHAKSGPQTVDHPDLMGRLFVIQATEDGDWTFRTAGDSLSALLGKDLGGQSFSDLWSGPDKLMVRGFLDAVRLDGAPGVIRGRGETLTGQRVELEVSVSPLTGVGRATARPRLLGLYQTLGGEQFLKGRPVFRHRVSAILPPDTRQEGPQLKLVANND